MRRRGEEEEKGRGKEEGNKGRIRGELKKESEGGVGERGERSGELERRGR
jgi:hypothetical protein